MRDCSAELATALDEGVTTLCRLLEVTRSDATVLRFTDHDAPVTVDADEYRADISFTSSAILASATYASAQSVSLYVALASSGGITEEDLRAKRYRAATARIMIVDRAHPEWGTMTVFKGIFGRVEITDKNKATIEIVPRSKGGLVNIGNEAYSPTCRAKFGDARCQFNLATVTEAFTVTAASGATFEAAELDQADDNWVLGIVTWVTGLNAGATSVVAASDQSDTSVTMVEPPLNPVEVGDTGTVVQGCSLMLSMCRDRYDNEENFRGEPYVPTSITYRTPAVTNVEWTHD
jgi:uncharacterized phage protein (TIGR02218 family)